MIIILFTLVRPTVHGFHPVGPLFPSEAAFSAPSVNTKQYEQKQARICIPELGAPFKLTSMLTITYHALE
ncbi:hypothetical protein JTB14_031169 [Gonioctena quinquepunctata]|nr:hypothetical protein JTB14_031169 [Gonioctena quinquepunctata]